jgi:prephenate dehydrogenase
MDDPEFGLRGATIAIIGLGLMGGSLALALRATKTYTQIIAIDPNESTRTQALACGAVDQASDDLLLVSHANVIVLATPVRAIIDLLPRVGAIARDNAIVIDLGSTKREIVQAMETLPARIQAVGGHPMCGKETSGFGSADANLYRNAVFALTPLTRTTAQTLAIAQALIETISAQTLVIDAERHDAIAATTSHLPFVVASALMAVASEQANQDEWLFRFAASGFRDTSRLAASDATMMSDIVLTNRANVVKMLRQYSAHLETLTQLIEHADAPTLRARFQTIAESRQKIFRR